MSKLIGDRFSNTNIIFISFIMSNMINMSINSEAINYCHYRVCMRGSRHTVCIIVNHGTGFQATKIILTTETIYQHQTQKVKHSLYISLI